MKGFLTVSSDIGPLGGHRPDDPDATPELPSDILAYRDFEGSVEWRAYYERNARHPVSAVLVYDDSVTRSVRVVRAGKGRRILVRVPEVEMRRATASDTCRDVYRRLIYEVWQTAADRFDWEKPLPEMPPYRPPLTGARGAV